MQIVCFYSNVLGSLKNVEAIAMSPVCASRNCCSALFMTSIVVRAQRTNA